MKRTIGILVFGLLFTVGCEKEVKLTFVNETNNDVPLSLQTSRGANESMGIVKAGGGATERTFKYKKEQLPVQVSWKAGDYCGKFDITDKTNKNLRIDFLPDGPSGPYKWKGKFSKKKHKKHKDKEDDEEDDD